MPGCSAVGCSNSAKKGFLMKKFPKEPKRRAEWAIRTKRDKWVPTDSSVLCEVYSNNIVIYVIILDFFFHITVSYETKIIYK
jgi:hypothetical protein